MTQDHIRNFAIIAHIDHGKSTLADRLLELTGTVAKRDMQAQLLDSNPIERERGITIKLAPVRMEYNGYVLNLIDTPGHVDFGYEVSRSLAACEGALLVVDATQGVQAQTLANLHQARAHNLTIIPIINKIDMPNARIEDAHRELRALEFRDEDILEISAKLGTHVDRVLNAIIRRIPPPSGGAGSALRALVFSSQYDPHKGVVVFVRVVDGQVSMTGPVAGFPPAPPTKGTPAAGGPPTRATRLRFLASGAEVTPIEVGYFIPAMQPQKGLATGEVGYIATGLKDIRFAKVGDTITSSIVIAGLTRNPSSSNTGSRLGGRDDKGIGPLPGYKEPKPMVFLSLFPINSDEFTLAREAMEKLRLSDSAFTFRPISSTALGHGFHCGFLGLLHAEIVQERLSREFDLNMIATAPSVEYHLTLKPGVSLSKLGFTASSVIVPSAQKEDLRVARVGGSPAAGVPFVGGAGGKPATGPVMEVILQSAAEFPDPTYLEEVKEPMMRVTVYAPSRYVGAIMQLCQEKRGDYIDLKYIDVHGHEAPHRPVPSGTGHGAGQVNESQVEMEYLIPLSEMIIDFFDRLKSISEGYASLDYEFFEFQTVSVVKIDILVNKERVDALAFLAVRDQAHQRGIAIVDRLAAVIPRQQFEIPIQAAIGGQIVARSDVKSFRKDVIQKLYGGDRTRKDKLLKKQAKGKARMKMIGRVEIPQSAFFEVLKRE